MTYSNTKTPTLTSMSKRHVSVLGGDTITFTGTGFSASATTKVSIDDRDCVVDTNAASTTSITCTTSNKPYKPDEPRLVINIDGFGNVATMNKVIVYVSLWSAPETWGGDLPP